MKAIKIPIRIERGPTDILKALASTVISEPEQPFNDIQDDAYLAPRRPYETRLFITAKLSGVKTAQFIFRKYPELFFRDDAEPKVEAFSVPTEEQTEE